MIDVDRILRGMGNPPMHARGCRHCKENQPMSRHTTEPLIIAPDRIHGLIEVCTEDGLHVATFRYSDNPRATREIALANARLFIGAADLRNALLALLAWECSPASAKGTNTEEEAIAYMVIMEAATKAIAKTKEKSI